MRKTFVSRGGFQAPRTMVFRHDPPPEQAPARHSAAAAAVPATPMDAAPNKRPRLEPSPRGRLSVSAVHTPELSLPPPPHAEVLQSCEVQKLHNTEEVNAPRVFLHTTHHHTPLQPMIGVSEGEEVLFESQEILQREVEEDLRLSEDLAFTPSKTTATSTTAGHMSPPFALTQPVQEEEEEGKKEGRVAMESNAQPAGVLFDGVEGGYGNSSSGYPAPMPALAPAPVVNSSGVFYDLPQSVQTFFETRRGIKKLYPWQHEVLMRDDVRGGGSLVYSQPTSGGKTLVAEISLLRCLLNRQKSCFFVLPFVSLAEEKTEALRPLGDALGYAVDGHYGTQGRLPLPRRTAVYVCTLEKANSVLNHMLDEGLIGGLGAVVVDELHMLGESRRGATLELFLSKLLCFPNKVQIIGMSATIPNLPNIATWLRASCYVGTYRPVPLRQHAVVEGMVMLEGNRNERNLVAAGCTTESEQLLLLATEVEKASVLIFCASRQQCVDTARLIARHRSDARNGYNTSTNDASAIAALLADLSSLDHDASQLSYLIPHGVAFHHGGLLGEERELIERAYRQRLITILCCTSTLAAGVNLPARRVIFKTPYVGRDFLTKSRYLQMCGRAGRAGLDEFGESFLLLPRRDCMKGRALMQQDVEPCLSQMLEEASAFERCVLECIAVGVIRSLSDAHRWMGNLLCHHAAGPFDASYNVVSRPLPVVLDDILQSALRQLEHSGLVQRVPRQTGDGGGVATHPTTHSNDGGGENNNSNKNNNKSANNNTDETVSLSATPFGTCSVRSCFSIEEALLVREELEHMQRTGLILVDDLHLCYYLTPLREIGDCNWSVYRDALSQLSDTRQRIANMIGVDEFFVHQRAMGLGDPAGNSNSQLFRTRRFFVAMMLADLLSEVPMSVLEHRYQCNRGQLQSLMRSASMFSSSITSFCRAMEWFSLEAVLASYVKRLGFGVKPDIVPLMELRGVQPGRARALWVAGFKDPAAIAACNPEELVRRVKASNPPDNKTVKFFSLRSAISLVRQANVLLQQTILEKKGELLELTHCSRVPQ
ncbi:putative ATP-dependent RNA helicase [Trypanosoma grayi]|uniref:putative ATP-dependent RNA helicase n=1 Tax=Trypanosoma grayi TaxID=71804 RepID=UPI0004F46512|nr:putative ATP-dependent RNA helicase [Trypanosoma grayi]KEG14449.1 putative ATP-dependent RNA helicase [Trypanosoma grayi]